VEVEPPTECADHGRRGSRAPGIASVSDPAFGVLLQVVVVRVLGDRLGLYPMAVLPLGRAAANPTQTA
jgi:hypothetical protein